MKTGSSSRTLFLLLAAVLIATACGSGSESETANDQAVTDTSQPQIDDGGADGNQSEPDAATPTEADLDAAIPDPDEVVLNESVEWTDCQGLECGTVVVPLDYADPQGDTLDIAIAVHRATEPSARIGYLFVNPGGPGESGLSYAAAAAQGPGFGFSKAVIERFDIVGFDPRGVGASEPTFACGEPGEQLAVLNQIDGVIDTDEEIALGEQAVALCTTSMGPVAGLLGSESVARDMDEIRKALGTDQVSYFGASYGSTLGTWYATLFPNSVRAMVVDGADNPVDDLSTSEARLENQIEELRQFEILLGAALDACDLPECPIYNDGDPRGFYLDHAADLSLVNEALGDEPTAGALGLVTTLYSEQSWPALWQGLADLADGDPSLFVQLAQEQLGDTIGAANFTVHVNCLDQWVLQPKYDRDVQLGDAEEFDTTFEETFPLLSKVDVESMDPCPFYDTIAPEALAVPLDGSGVPILVIGNPSDPATPYTESVELVEETLSNGVLVQADHFSHVVYPNNTCVVRLVEDALVNLELPESGVICAAEAPEDRPIVAMNTEEVTDAAFQICFASTAESDVARETLEAACATFAERVLERFDTETLSDAIQGNGDQATADALVEILIETFTEFGISLPE